MDAQVPIEPLPTRAKRSRGREAPTPRWASVRDTKGAGHKGFEWMTCGHVADLHTEGRAVRISEVRLLVWYRIPWLEILGVLPAEAKQGDYCTVRQK